MEPTDKQFAQGSDAKVDCKADGFPQPQISWKKAAGRKSLNEMKVSFILNYCRKQTRELSRPGHSGSVQRESDRRSPGAEECPEGE